MNRDEEICAFWILGLTPNQIRMVSLNKDSHYSVSSFPSPSYRSKHAHTLGNMGFDLSKL